MQEVRSAIDAVAQAWSSIDGNLDHYLAERDLGIDAQTTGHGSGYEIEAEELIKRLNSYGYDVVKKKQKTKPKQIVQPKVTKKQLIKWVNDNPEAQERLRSSIGANRTIEVYLDEYAYIKDIVVNLAWDLDYPNLSSEEK